MAKDSLFRISLQGFNKQDVLDYIENLNVRYNKQTKEFEGEIDELNKQLEMLPELLKAKENYDKLKEENEILLKEKNDLEEALKAQTSLIEEKDKALEEKDQLIDEAYAENAKCGERIRELEKSKPVSGAGILQKDLISEEFEEILNQARQEAESVMIKARDLAKEIINTAKEKAKIHEEEAKEKAEEVLRQSDEAVRDNLKKVKYLNRKKDELSGIFMDHKNQMETFFTSITQSLKDE